MTNWKAPTAPAAPMKLTQAIARIEGFYAQDDKPNRPQRNHNPGDIEYDAFSRAHGAVGTDGRFAIFADDDAGFAALEALLRNDHYAKLTLKQAINRYAPPCENNTAGYVARVCQWTGNRPDDVVEAIV